MAMENEQRAHTLKDFEVWKHLVKEDLSVFLDHFLNMSSKNHAETLNVMAQASWSVGTEEMCEALVNGISVP